ncbi:hypothetical protein [[Eubacterium] cellulosolvens]
MTQEKVKCESCGNITPKEWTFMHNGRIMCEDCYIDAQQTLKACDPFAVQSAKIARELSGHKGTEGLTDIQKQIYELVQSKGKILTEQLINEFDLTSQQLEKQLAILRHCELIKGQKIDGQVYIVPF